MVYCFEKHQASSVLSINKAPHSFLSSGIQTAMRSLMAHVQLSLRLSPPFGPFQHFIKALIVAKFNGPMQTF